ncbi:hypothetical protein GQ53DRAFT_693617 [Thozetella sp. PMI_491]|nr:hypothetical protein GQ53DRAFT_693617 [Thozetella sp. PMI_491]
MAKAQEQEAGSSTRCNAGSAAAQRQYRVRQRARARNLELLAVERWMFKRTSTTAQHKGLIEQQAPISFPQAAFTAGLVNSVSFHNADTPSRSATALSSSDVFGSLSSCGEHERYKLSRIMANERFGFRNIIKFGLISLGYPVSPELIDSAQLLPMRGWIDQILVTIGSVDLRTVVTAGVVLLGNLSEPVDAGDETVERFWHHLHLPAEADMRKNYITFRTESLAWALTSNALHLGIPAMDILLEGAQSPFFHPQWSLKEQAGSSNGVAPTSCADISLACGARRPPGLSSDIQQDLRPTIEQFSIPHHPCYDVLPWPTVRSNILTALSMDPPAIDEEDLCLDLMNDGIRFWGSAKDRSLHGRGEGMPWDSRSWEAAPWFLSKWEILAGGRNGEMWRTSTWWHHSQAR